MWGGGPSPPGGNEPRSRIASSPDSRCVRLRKRTSPVWRFSSLSSFSSIILCLLSLRVVLYTAIETGVVARWVILWDTTRDTDGDTIRMRGHHTLIRLLGQAAAQGARPDAEGACPTSLLLHRHHQEDRGGSTTTLAATGRDAGRVPVRARRGTGNVRTGRPRESGAGRTSAVPQAGKGRSRTQTAALRRFVRRAGEGALDHRRGAEEPECPAADACRTGGRR